MVCHWSGHWWFFAALGQATPRISVVPILHWCAWCACCLLFASASWRPIVAKSFCMVPMVLVSFWEQIRAGVVVIFCFQHFTTVYMNAMMFGHVHCFWAIELFLRFSPHLNCFTLKSSCMATVLAWFVIICRANTSWCMHDLFHTSMVH